MTKKQQAQKRKELKATIKKLQTQLDKITPPKKRSKSYGRTKGLAFERFIAGKLKSIFPEVRRQLEFQVQDAKGTDLQGTDEFKVQCKKYADYVPVSTINEVQLRDWAGDVPVLVTAGTSKEPMVVMRLEDWLDLVKASRRKSVDETGLNRRY